MKEGGLNLIKRRRDTFFAKKVSRLQHTALTFLSPSNKFEIPNMYHHIFALHSKVLRAMSHPKRLEIIHLLRNQKLCVSDIQEMLGLPQANLSQHLQILKEANILKTKKQGKNVYYRLSHINFVKASDLIREVLVEQAQDLKDQKLVDELTLKMTDLVPLVHDPVCHMRLSPKTASVGIKYQGESYYFCATGCYEKFIKNPAKYISSVNKK